MSNWGRPQFEAADSSEIMPMIRTSESLTRESRLYDCFSKDYPEYFNGHRIFTFSKELHGKPRKNGSSAPVLGLGIVSFNQSELDRGNIPLFAAVRLPIAGSKELTNRFVTTRAEEFTSTDTQSYCVGAIAKATYSHLQNERQPFPGVLDTLGLDNDAFVRAFFFEDK